MKKINSLPSRSSFKGLALAAMATVFGVSSCTTDFDLDTRTPEWLGTSIFETLDKGFEGDSGKVYHFQNFVKLIQDLNQDNILDKTGSKTLFVADDDAFDRFFGANCPFKKADGTPVTCYDELSYAQKTMILKGSMLNNVYQVAMLSSSEGPTLGDCMRRLSSSSVYDTVPVLTGDRMPDNNEYWNYYRTNPTRSAGMAVMQDGTVRPMIFFVNKFLTTKKITDDDYDFLFNQGKYGNKPARNPADASVNGVRIEYQNKKCFNGFLHVMEEVIYLLPNMAEYLDSDKDNSVIYSRILDRFSAPFYNSTHTSEIKRLYSDKKVNVPLSAQDSVFVKRYYSKRTQGDVKQSTTPQGKTFGQDQELLKFDPGWNSYFTESSGNTETNVALQQNMAVMIVPTDTAMTQWWLEGGGKALRARYGKSEYRGRTDLSHEEVARDMDSIPRKVIVKLLNNNMLNSLVSSVPSKFGSVLNDANDPMDLEESTIDSVVMCCNGAVYFTNTVYAPTAYRSVSYPALVNENLQIIDWAIADETLSFSAYLNSMVATYSFFIPTADSDDPNLKGKIVWVDPASFALNKFGSSSATSNLYAMVFSYDQKKSTVYAETYQYDLATNKITGTGTNKIEATEEDETGMTVIRDRFQDLLDYHIIIGNVEDQTYADANGYSYFQTKGRGTIRVKSVSDPSVNFANMEVAGGFQLENANDPNAQIKIVERYDMKTVNGNGRTYIIDKPLVTSRKSVYDVLSDSVTYPEFQQFFQLMQAAVGSDGKSMFQSISNGNEIGSRYNVSTFNTYHYSVYVPTNASIQKLLEDKVIFSPQALSDIDDHWSQVYDDVYGGENADSVWADSMAVLSLQLTGVSDKTFNYKTFTDKQRDRIRNFVRYHIQDNSVYVNAEFSAGYDNFGNPATSANYETAYMNSANQQFVKINVTGGSAIELKDKNGNVRHVLPQNSISGAPLYNIMCREYEFTTTDGKSMSKISTAEIETSSYAVIHLIDGALSNGDVVF